MYWHPLWTLSSKQILNVHNALCAPHSTLAFQDCLNNELLYGKPLWTVSSKHIWNVHDALCAPIRPLHSMIAWKVNFCMENHFWTVSTKHILNVHDFNSDHCAISELYCLSNVWLACGHVCCIANFGCTYTTTWNMNVPSTCEIPCESVNNDIFTPKPHIGCSSSLQENYPPFHVFFKSCAIVHRHCCWFFYMNTFFGIYIFFVCSHLMYL